MSPVCSSKSVKNVFRKMRTELFKNSDGLKVTKLSINIIKTNFILFHKFRAKENLPQKLLLLSTDSLEI